MYLSRCDVELSEVIVYKFKTDTRENGGTMNMNQGTTVTLDDEIIAQFIADTGKISEGTI